VAVLARSIPVRLVWVLLMCAATAGCRFGAEQWGPFRGRMVDAETGAPIPGAHFMVSWERDLPNPVHWTQSFYDAQEAVTDADGRFEIPHRRRFFTLLVSEPRFSAFAPGYFAESEEAISPGTRLYVDETILRMRLLNTREARCKRRWGGPLADVGSTVPNIMEALDRYTTELKCWELTGGGR
jgi:hypothetical protein